MSQRRKVEVERIGLVYAQLAVLRELGPGEGGQVAVDFYDIEVAGAFQHFDSERAASRSDLDQMLVRLRIQGVDDALNDIGIVEEVLAEAFPDCHLKPVAAQPGR